MVDFLADLDWLDWVALALAAYGLVAGACRGSVHQFIRLLVLLASLAVVGLLGTPLIRLVESLTRPGPDTQVLGARLELALFLVVLPALTLLRRLLAGEGNGPRGWGGRLGGALTGLLASLVLASVVGCAAYWIDGGRRPVEARGAVVGRRIAELAAYLPSPPRPGFLVPRAFAD